MKHFFRWEKKLRANAQNFTEHFLFEIKGFFEDLVKDMRHLISSFWGKNASK